MQKYVPVREIEWIGGRLPLDEPECGYENQRCVLSVGARTSAPAALSAIYRLVSYCSGLHYEYEAHS